MVDSNDNTSSSDPLTKDSVEARAPNDLTLSFVACAPQLLEEARATQFLTALFELVVDGKTLGLEPASPNLFVITGSFADEAGRRQRELGRAEGIKGMIPLT